MAMAADMMVVGTADAAATPDKRPDTTSENGSKAQGAERLKRRATVVAVMVVGR
jgi:hypothetical protein